MDPPGFGRLNLKVTKFLLFFFSDAETRAGLADAQPVRLAVDAFVDLVRVLPVRKSRTAQRAAAKPLASVQLLEPERNHTAGRSPTFLFFKSVFPKSKS